MTMLNNFIKCPIEIYDNSEKEYFQSLGVDKQEEVEIVDVYLDKTQIESFRASWYTGRKEEPCTSVVMKSGDSFCVSMPVEEFINLLLLNINQKQV